MISNSNKMQKNFSSGSNVLYFFFRMLSVLILVIGGAAHILCTDHIFRKFCSNFAYDTNKSLNQCPNTTKAVLIRRVLDFHFGWKQNVEL